MSVTRRDFLALLGTSVAAGAVVAVGVSKSAASAPATVSGNWIVDQIGAVSKGAVPITLRHDVTGETLRVDACRRGLASNPVASSAHFDLFIANNGRGAAPTTRQQLAAVKGLAAHLDRNVADVPAQVLTMRERQAAHAELHTTSDDVLA